MEGNFQPQFYTVGVLAYIEYAGLLADLSREVNLSKVCSGYRPTSAESCFEMNIWQYGL